MNKFYDEDNLCTEKNNNENTNGIYKSSKSYGIGPLTPIQTNQKAYYIRVDAASFQKDLPLPNHPNNGDENLYISKIANFSKAMPHNELGEVDMGAYNIWIKALTTANPKIFEQIPLGGVIKLANPQASYAFDLEGPNSHHLTMPPAPTFCSAWEASEMGENYWQALTLDIPFADYYDNTLIRQACCDMSQYSDYHGPKECGKVTPRTIFRGNLEGDLIGPYISQFLWKDIPYGVKTIEQHYPTALPGKDYMTSYDEWLNIQNGGLPSSTGEYDPQTRFIRDGRDLANYVHADFTYQAVLNACLILLSFGKGALCVNNPYLCSKTQNGFITFGAAYILDFVSKAVRVALEAAWFQKFLVHRRLRPEAFGGCIQNNLMGRTNYPINSEILNSCVLSKVYHKYGSYLLPMAYPEGSPTHPAYPAGHACAVGAGVTMLKAFFNEDYIIDYPYVASADGLYLIPYKRTPLTVGGELNKLASNISIGRDYAGVHWRSDGIEGLKIGEAVAIGILHDFKKTYNETFNGFCLTKFDGTTIII